MPSLCSYISARKSVRGKKAIEVPLSIVCHTQKLSTPSTGAVRSILSPFDLLIYYLQRHDTIEISTRFQSIPFGTERHYQNPPERSITCDPRMYTRGKMSLLKMLRYLSLTNSGSPNVTVVLLHHPFPCYFTSLHVVAILYSPTTLTVRTKSSIFITGNLCQGTKHESLFSIKGRR